MKTISKKLMAIKATEAVRKFSISLAAVGIVALMLYVLINSPA
ncbi:MAG TPA: hypothetical protein VM871_12630 [Flavisolibacter sp.]|jgi:hypothetical protein|nr:hypothetical protein [Flavisolibacter sp.]